jgi:hypothetical protein
MENNSPLVKNGTMVIPARLNITGYTQSDFVSVAQQVSAWNQGKPVTAVCNIKTLKYILPEKSVSTFSIDWKSDFIQIDFLGVKLITSNELLRKLKKFNNNSLSKSEIYLACLRKNNFDFEKVVGVIELGEFVNPIQFALYRIKKFFTN